MNEHFTKYNTGGYKKSGPSKRYLNFSVSRKNVQSTDANETQSNATLLEISFMNLDKNDFSTNGIAGTLDDNYHWLTNEDFNLFRKNTNNGEDFLIFSEVEKQSLSAKIHNK